MTASTPTTETLDTSVPQKQDSWYWAGSRDGDLPFEQSVDYRPEPEKPAELAPFVRKQKQRLLDHRDRLWDQMRDVAQDNLRVTPELGGGSAFDQHTGDAGSDACEKDSAVSLLSQKQDSLHEIEAALKRIDAGTFGLCEKSGENIPHERLEAIPWARFTVECQAEFERSLRGRSRGESGPDFMDVSETAEEEEEPGEEARPRAKE